VLCGDLVVEGALEVVVTMCGDMECLGIGGSVLMCNTLLHRIVVREASCDDCLVIWNDWWMGGICLDL
jgi:hypothetical protein